MGGVCASVPLIGQTAGQYVPSVGSECDEMMRVLFLGAVILIFRRPIILASARVRLNPGRRRRTTAL